MGEFIDTVRAAGSPTQQLKALNAYRPSELAGGGGASEEQWDAAVYTTLDRATLLKHLMRSNSSSGGAAAASSGGGSNSRGFGGAGGSSGAGSPASSVGTATSVVGGGEAPASVSPFTGPVVALLPRDRVGVLMLEATRQALRRPAAAPGVIPGEHSVVHVPLETRHTECLLSEQGRAAAAVLLADAVRAVLLRL